MYVKKKDLLMQPIKRIDPIAVGEQADFEVSVVRGMESVDIRVPGIKVSDEYIKVPKLVFEERILRYCNQALRELYDDMGVDLMHSSYFERPKQVSISSFAKNVPGQVSMLLDLFSANDRNDELTAFLLEVKICELKSLACYSDLEEYFVEKYHNYFGIDFSGLFVNGVDPLDED